MTSDPDQIRAQIEETRVNLSQDVNHLADTVNPAQAARRKVASAQSALTGVKDKVMGTVSQSASGPASAAGDRVSAVQGAARDTISTAQDKVSAAPSQLRRQTRGNPLAVGLIALGAGWLVGSLLPASQAEEQAASRVKEAAAPAVTGAAKEAAAGLQDTAQQAAESVKNSAAGAAATVKDEAAGHARDVQGQAQDARATVTDRHR
jgi:Protein of unknown function (DUF3618)